MASTLLQHVLNWNKHIVSLVDADDWDGAARIIARREIAIRDANPTQPDEIQALLDANEWLREILESRRRERRESLQALRQRQHARNAYASNAA
ncbi:MAG: hypothetical protein AAGA84_01340 [Pseudomonadota bacterium]